MACPVRMCNINMSNFTLKWRHLSFIFAQNRYFCSKDNDVITKISSSSKEKPDEEAKVQEKTTVKRKPLQLKSVPVSDEVKEAAKQKLKSLLLSIQITSEKRDVPTSNLKLAKPLKRISKKERLKQMEAEKITPEKEMDMAVKAVASSFKEDSEKVKSELNEKLKSLKLTKDVTVTEEIKDSGDLSQMDINQNLMSSVEEVAETLSENPIPPRSELTKRLMKLSLGQKVASDEKKSMRSVIEGMVFEKKPSVTQPETFSHQIQRRIADDDVKRMMTRRKPPGVRRIDHVNLFDAAPMNMFTPGSEIKPDSTNTLWQKLQEREVRLLTQFAPANAFEEMIMWTEQGKHWTFPIDNEVEMGEEEKVGFHEHVFLERHLKGFPTRGPIRHFMELVCVGLSKNPYITVERKVENIEWFRNYFNDKEELLKEVGAID